MDKGTFDAIQNLSVLTARAHSGKRGRSIKPAKPWPTPDEALRKQESSKPKVSLAQINRLIQS